MTKQNLPIESSGELNARVRGGTRAVLVALLVSQGVSFGVLAVMCRLVVPDAYGLLGQILPALMLPRMAATLGLSTAVVQHPELSHDQLSRLFWFNLVGGLVSTVATAAIGPVLAFAYGRPELMSLCLAMAGTNLLAALLNQHSAMLERTLRMTELSVVRCLAQVAGGVAGIGTALVGYDVGALIAQQYAELGALAVGVWLAMPWRPSWPRRDAAVGSVVAFSSYFSLSSIVGYVAQNLEKIVFPLLLGPQADRAIGLYSQAFNLMLKPALLITAPLTGVMVSALARARGDGRAFAEMTTRFFRLAAIGLFPCSAGMFAVAPDFVLVLAGPEWRDAGPLLAALAPALFAQGLINLAGYLLASVGRAGQLLFATVLFCLLLVQGFIVGYFAGGYAWPVIEGTSLPTAMGPMLGIAASYTAVTVGVWTIPFLWFCFRTSGASLSDTLRRIGPSLQPAVLMGLIVWGLRQVLMNIEWIDVGPRLVVLVVVGVLLYALLARREMRWFLDEWIHLSDRKDNP